MRTYFYTIDSRGRVVHGGTEITDERFLHIFYRLMAVNETGENAEYPYVSPCGREMNYVQAHDTPVVFHQLSEGALFYAPGLSVPFRPESLRFSDGGVLYHEAPVGGVGRLDAGLALELGKCIVPWGPCFAYEPGSEEVDGEGWSRAKTQRRKEDRAGEVPHEGGRATVIEPLKPDSRYRVIRPRPDNTCFGCGEAHPFGPALSFLFDAEDNSVRTWFTPDVRMQGSTGWMHGGFTALLLDEVMGKTLSANNMGGAPTARLEVNYRRPARIGVRMELVGRLEEHGGRKYTLVGELREAEGENLLLANGRGLFIRPKVRLPG